MPLKNGLSFCYERKNMKRIIIKAIASLLVVVLTSLTLFSCGEQQNNNSNNGNNNNNNNYIGDGVTRDNIYYYSVKTLYSYDDVMDALAIVRQRYKANPTYTVKDMGDDYMIFYHFWVANRWTAYPIDYDTYFNTKSNGYFITYIYFENQSCDDSSHSGLHGSMAPEIYKEEEDYEKKMEYIKDNPCVRVDECLNYYGEIEDPKYLSYQLLSSWRGGEYLIRYRGNEIFKIGSCIELDDEFFDKFFECLVTTSVTE